MSDNTIQALKLGPAASEHGTMRFVAYVTGIAMRNGAWEWAGAAYTGLEHYQCGAWLYRPGSGAPEWVLSSPGFNNYGTVSLRTAEEQIKVLRKVDRALDALNGTRGTARDDIERVAEHALRIAEILKLPLVARDCDTRAAGASDDRNPRKLTADHARDLIIGWLSRSR